jgi:heme exporter protein B
VTVQASESRTATLKPFEKTGGAGVTLFFKRVMIIAAKDLRSELRTKEALNASVAFSIVILVLFSFAFDPTSDQTRDFSGGLLWLVYTFAGALLLNRSFVRETQNDCLDGLLAAPVSAAALFLGKALANFALLMAIELVSLPVFALFYDVRFTGQLPALLGILVLGTWALSVIGTFFSALTVNLRIRELMLPTLVYPLMIPALMSAMTLTTTLLAGEPIANDQMLSLKMLVAFDIVFSLLSIAFVDTVLVG